MVGLLWLRNCSPRQARPLILLHPSLCASSPVDVPTIDDSPTAEKPKEKQKETDVIETVNEDDITIEEIEIDEEAKEESKGVKERLTTVDEGRAEDDEDDVKDAESESQPVTDAAPVVDKDSQSDPDTNPETSQGFFQFTIFCLP